MKISRKAEELTQSLTRKLFDMAQGVDDVIDLTLGDPDIMPPESIRMAAMAAIRLGKTRYSQNAGLLEARRAIVDFNHEVFPEEINTDNVIITCGGMEAIYLALAALIDPDDEVIIPAPYWVNYKQMTQLCGGRPVIVPTKESDNFAVRPDDIERAVTAKTKVLILNSPNNPTGRVVDGCTLDEIAKLVEKYDLFVISDEVYRSLVYDNVKHESICSRAGMKGRSILIDSMSKRYSMTGYRLGYGIGPAELITYMTRMQENVAACAPLPSQYAAIAAYSERPDTAEIQKEFAARRKLIIDGLKDIPCLSLSGIDGTFYAFINISMTGLNSYDFALQLLSKRKVAVVPGRTYGDGYDQYVRLAFTVNQDKLQAAVSRIQKFVVEDLNCFTKEGK